MIGEEFSATKKCEEQKMLLIKLVIATLLLTIGFFFTRMIIFGRRRAKAGNELPDNVTEQFEKRLAYLEERHKRSVIATLVATLFEIFLIEGMVRVDKYFLGGKHGQDIGNVLHSFHITVAISFIAFFLLAIWLNGKRAPHIHGKIVYIPVVLTTLMIPTGLWMLYLF